MAETEGGIKSLAKAMKLLECFTVDHHALALSEIAEKLNITKSSAHHLIATLKQGEFIEQLPDRRYTLGKKMMQFSFIYNYNLGYPQAIFDILAEAANSTGQIVYFGIPSGTNVLYICAAHPDARLKDSQYREMAGAIAPLCQAGIGKAILANLPEDEWASRIPDAPPTWSETQTIDRAELVAELRLTRDRGFALDEGVLDKKVRCVGVPVYTSRGKLLGGISSSGSMAVMTDQKVMECVSVLQNAAVRISERVYN